MSSGQFDSLLGAIPAAAISQSDREMEALTRAQWGNLLAGIDTECLDGSEARRFLEALDAMLAVAMRSYTPSYTALRQAFVDVAAAQGPVLANGGQVGGGYAFLDKRPMPGPWSDQKPLTLQSCDCIQYWFRGAGVHVTEKPSSDEVDEAIDFFRTSRAKIPSANRVGRPGGAIWFTPVTSIDELSGPTPDRIRDELGVVISEPRRHGIVVTLAHRVDDIKDDVADGRLRAPTIFDSRGHPRFRHWPTASDDRERDAGRTYDLGAGAGRAKSDGRPELIHAPRPVNECIDMRNLGVFVNFQVFSEQDHIQFANDIVGSRGVRELVDDVIARV
jgi:hypothetical protein